MAVIDVGFDPTALGWLFGGLTQLIIAVWVYRLAPRDLRHRTFAVFLLVNGAWDVEIYLTSASQTPASYQLLARTMEHLHLWTSLALVAFLAAYPHRRRIARNHWFLPGLAGLAVAGSVLLALFPDAVTTFPSGTVPTEPEIVIPHVDVVVLLGSALFLWDHHRQVEGEADLSTLLVSMGLLTYLLVKAGGLWAEGVNTVVSAGTSWRFALRSLAAVLLAPLIVVAAARHPRGGPRLVGLLATLAVGSFLVGAYVPALYGIQAFLFASTVAYALAKHQLLDVDARLRFGISKSTLAGIFVAVFFAASEGAQVLFADVAGGNELVGVAAAALLVFFITPLQRLADRVAEEAVPPGGDGPTDDIEARYRDAVRLALADGEVSAAEEDELAERAEELGLGPKRALELRREVEDEAGDRGDQGGRV